MLYNLDWLKKGEIFPPEKEVARIQRYKNNEVYFASEHFTDSMNALYQEYTKRITRVIENYQDMVNFPVLFNYQRLLALKTADLVCGEYPIITGTQAEETEVLHEIREATDADSKFFATVIDLARYGDAIWRKYKDPVTGKYTFTLWDVKDWYPIVSQDGTLTITQHVLAWVVETPGNKRELHVQVHEKGFYTSYVYRLIPRKVGTVVSLNSFSSYNIGDLLSTERVATGMEENQITHIRNMYVSGTVYGYDDFTAVDTLIAELLTRVAQISKILDRHANPSMTGPASLAVLDENTGERVFTPGEYYGIGPQDTSPEYLVWNGELEAAFKEVDLLLQQLYILSEMGSAMLGVEGAGSGQAISGTAMRFKMTNPLAKARRISNLMTLPVKKLFEVLSSKGYNNSVSKDNISIIWQDGLPNDPREVLEQVRLATGETRIMPLDIAIEEYLERNPEEIRMWLEKLEEEKRKAMELSMANKQTETEPDGSYKKTGTVQEKGSTTGLNNPSRKGE